MYLNDVVIETTRKCNIKCDHCLRGNAQNKNIKSEYITTLFEQVSAIGSLTITGGEPALNVPAIEHIIAEAKRLEVSIGTFYIATNGMAVNEAFVVACLKLYALCEEKEACIVHVSNDTYHEGLGEVNTDLLNGLKFFDYKFDLNSAQYEPINEGRAKENQIGEPDRTPNIDAIKYDDDRIESLVYLNCNGDIVPSCDMSYTSQNKHKVCKVADLTSYAKGGAK